MRLRALLPLVLLVCLSARSTPAQTRNDRQSIVHNGARRTFVMRAPADISQRTELLPLIFVLHGGGGNAANAERMTGFTRIAERERAIVVYPEGSSRFRRTLLTWNAGHCCGYAMERSVDDVGYIGALLDTLIARYPVDPTRVYVTGMSNGGMMAHRLGRELSQRIAAIAPVVAAIFGDEPQPAQPVSAIIINGMLDKSVPYAGGAPGGRGNVAWDGTPARPSAEQGTYWALANSCDPLPQLREEGALQHTRYRCPAGRDVELYLVRDNGHAWPSGERGTRFGDPPSQSLDATAVIWAFFRAHARGVPSPSP